MAGATYFQRGYYDDTSVPMTAREREFLDTPRQTHQTAFRPRPQQSRASRRLPPSSSGMDVNHRLRTYRQESVHPSPSVPFHMWIECSRRSQPFPPKWDPEYNSNVWRNFSHGEGYTISSPRQRISDAIALTYPLRIPPPSELADRTFTKYVSESKKVIKDAKRREVVLNKSKRELKEFKLLKLRSQMRVPPMDGDGNILPPEGLKSYDHPEVRLPETRTVSLRQQAEHERDLDKYMMGTYRTSPTRLWRLSYRNNNPEYAEVMRRQVAHGSPVSARSTVSFRPSEIYFK